MKNWSKIIEKYANEWWKENFGKESLGEFDSARQEVFSLLDSKRDEVTLAAIGLEYSFGRYEVKRDSETAKIISKIAKDNIEQWMKDNLNPLPDLSKGNIEQLRRFYREQLAYLVEEVLRDRARSAAEETAQKILSETGYDKS